MGLLDESTYPFDAPDGRELAQTLADIYFSADSVVDFLRTAGLKPQDFRLDLAAGTLWMDVLDAAARQRRLRALVEAVAADPDSASFRSLTDRLLADAHDPLDTEFDAYSLALLPAKRAFIDRLDLRACLKEFGDDAGSRVLSLNGDNTTVGRSHSWYFINAVGERKHLYDAYRFDITDWSGAPQGPLDVMREICGQLGWAMPLVDPTAQQTALVRLLVASFKNLGRKLPGRTCLVFDGYTAVTADEWARDLVVAIAAAANGGEAGDLCVVLLEVEARLTSDLARDAMVETLRSAGVADLEDFFRRAAEAVGRTVRNEDLPLLVEKVLGTPPYPTSLRLPEVGPKAARVAAAVFGGAR